MSSWDHGRTVTRRQALRAGAGGALGLYGLGALSGCTVERALDLPSGGVTAKPKIDGDLLIYNWAQYMDPDIKKSFGDKYGVEVNEVNFDKLEAMVTKLRAGGRYDIIWPTPEYAYRLNQEGLVRDRPQGRQTHYSAQIGALAPLIDWTSQMTGFWQGKYDDLEDLLRRMDQ